MRREKSLLGASLRTFALVGHAGSGKTQLAEMMLHAGGVVRQPGTVDDGTALLDGEPEEANGGGSVFVGAAWLPWNDAVVHVIDTPGNDAALAARALAREGCDADLLVVSGPDGVEWGAERVLRAARHDDRALIAVIQKVDRHVDVEALCAGMHDVVRRPVVCMQQPVHEDGVLVGVIDLLAGVLRRYDPEGSGAMSVEPVPGHLAAEARAARERLWEAVALSDEALLEAYLEHLALPEDVVWTALRRGVRHGTLLPVFVTAASVHVGVDALLDAMVKLTPDPTSWRLPASEGPEPERVVRWVATRIDDDGAPVALFRVLRGVATDQQVWHGPGGRVRLRRLYQVRGRRRAKAKTPLPGAWLASWEIPPGKPGDVFTDGPPVALVAPVRPPPMVVRALDRASEREDWTKALTWLTWIDPGLEITPSPDERTVVLRAAHERQATLAVKLLRGRWGLDVSHRPAPVPAYLWPEGPVRDAHGLHRCDDGLLTTEMGEVWLDLEPVDVNAEIAVTFDVDDEDLPARFHPAVAEGVRRGLEEGRGGRGVRGVRVTCVDGAYDMLVSEPAHLARAGYLAARAAIDRVPCRVVEPVVDVHVFVPSDCVGAVIADLSAHGGRVVGMQVADDETSIEVHLAERVCRDMHGRLESLTHGRGWFISRPSHLQVRREPSHTAKRVRGEDGATAVTIR